MANDQRPAVEAAIGDNVMGKVLSAFDGLVDNATATVCGAASAAKDHSAGLVKRAARSLKRSARKPPTRPAASAS